MAAGSTDVLGMHSPCCSRTDCGLRCSTWICGDGTDEDSDWDLTLALALALALAAGLQGWVRAGQGRGNPGVYNFLCQPWCVPGSSFLLQPLLLTFLPSLLPSVHTKIAGQMDAPHLTSHSPALGKETVS